MGAMAIMTHGLGDHRTEKVGNHCHRVYQDRAEKCCLRLKQLVFVWVTYRITCLSKLQLLVVVLSLLYSFILNYSNLK